MKTTKAIYALFALLFFSLTTSASHFKGGETYFRCLGNGYYKLVFNCFYGCEAGSSTPYAPSLITFSLSSTCVTVPSSIACTQATSAVTLPDYCPGVPTTCDYYVNGNIPAGTPSGTLLVTYSTDSFQLPAGCTVSASLDLGSRNAAVTNLVGASSSDMYLTATINTPANGCGFTPLALSTPVSILPLGITSTISYGVNYPGADSIIYTLINPQTSGGVAIPFAPGYTVQHPMGSAATLFTLDRRTGSLAVNPSATGNYVITVAVQIYKAGVQIGYMMRDWQIQTVTTSVVNNPPRLINKFDAVHVSGAVAADSTMLTACVGSAIQITLRATDPDAGSYIYDSTDAATALAGSTVSLTHTAAGADTTTLTIAWSPATQGYYTFSLSVRDSACPRPAQSRYNFVIYVSSGVYAGANQIRCAGGAPVTLTATGGGLYHWTDITGGAPAAVVSYTLDSSTVVVAPSVPASYIVSSSITGQCPHADTVSVSIAPSFTLSSAATPAAVCYGASSVLSTLATPASVGPFTYHWASPVVAGTPGSGNTGPVTNSQVYRVTVTAAGGCTITDSISVHISGGNPHISLSASANDICPGDTVGLHASVAFINTVPNGINDTCATASTFRLGRVYATYDTLISTTTGTPFSYYPTQKVQYLLRPAELLAAGLTSGLITDLSFYLPAIPGGTAYDSFSVSMGPTGVDSLTDFVNGLYTVLDPGTVYAQQGWTPIPFTHYYQWDGHSNVVIQVYYSRSSSAFTNDEAIASDGAALPGSTVMALGTGNGSTLSAASTLTGRPAMRLGMCIPVFIAHYLWTPHTIVADTVLNTAAVVNNSTTFTFTATDQGGCHSTDSIRISRSALLPARSLTQASVCAGDTLQLHAFDPAFQPVCVQDYSVSSITYAAATGTQTSVPAASFFDGSGFQNNDDGTAGPFTIPFAFPFYCQSYQRVYINSNGWISFVNPYPATTGSQQYIAQTLPPTASSLNPRKMIALTMGDYQVSNNQVSYFTTGTAPARTFVVRFSGLQALSGSGTTSGEIQLHEAGGYIDILIGSSNITSANHTTGLKDSTGRGVAAPGRNNVAYTVAVPEAWRFVPAGAAPLVSAITWTPATGLFTPQSGVRADTIADPYLAPVATQTYISSVTVQLHPLTSQAVCHVRDTVQVTVDHFTHNLSAGRPVICGTDTTQLHFTTTNTLDSIIWSPATWLSSATVAAPVDTPYADILYHVTAWDANGCRVTDSIRIRHAGLSVWPGDADDNGVADNDDLLAVGLAFGESGPARAGASLVWTGQCATAWGTTTGGTDHVYADCDGNGTVGYADTTVILTNWNLTHAKTSAARSSSLDLTITTDRALYEVGDTITARIAVSNAAAPVPLLYGVSYDFAYASRGVAHILSADQSASWTGQKLSLQKIASPTTAYLAQSRIDHRDTTGYGQIAEIRLRIDGGITTVDSGYLSVDRVLAVTSNGDTVILNTTTKGIVIDRAPDGVADVSAPYAIDIYPNPNKGSFRISRAGTEPLALTIIDALGREVMTRSLVDPVTTLDISAQPSGVYTAIISGTSGSVTRKVILAR